eukprot:6122932-Prymnesium_polylepis.1
MQSLQGYGRMLRSAIGLVCCAWAAHSVMLRCLCWGTGRGHRPSPQRVRGRWLRVRGLLCPAPRAR